MVEELNYDLNTYYMYLLQLNKHTHKLSTKQKQQLIINAQNFACKCYNYFKIYNSCENLCNKFNYKIVKTDLRYSDETTIIKASIISSKSQNEIILYQNILFNISKVAIKYKLNITLEELIEAATVHECFHLIEQEIYNMELVNNNKLKNRFYQSKVFELSEIAANMFTILVLKKEHMLWKLDFYYLIEKKITTYVEVDKILKNCGI